ncbi:MAG: hypothetical protein RJA36_1147 [Pseudomonadota bacterium]|jgi:uncharacterized protein (DUF1810 family)
MGGHTLDQTQRDGAQPASLQRFVDAQDGVLPAVMAELQAGSKRSHWMWFVFPQLRALGRSATALHYGLADLEEARRYLAHPVLGPRLLECTRAVLAHSGRSAHAIFGSPDDLKFRSCMTLFGLAAPQQPLFAQALAAFYGGEPDRLTLELA